jgi:kynurenine formamidase
MRSTRLAALAAVAISAAAPAAAQAQSGESALWKAYDETISKARHIDLTHDITPSIPVWKGFGPSTFAETVKPETGQPYSYAKDGFVVTAYQLSTDQLGTQLDPPAHWAPEYPSIDELPPTYAVRRLVVINVAAKVRKDPKYFASVADIRGWEIQHGRIPSGSVVMFRSDWSKRWTEDPVKAKALAADRNFPSVSLAALKFLHLQRKILFHGHEPLDTDSTPTIEGENWLMHHGYAQAEGVTNLAGVPSTGCLINIGFPKFKGGVGGYARFVAICPPATKKGTRISGRDAPLPKSDDKLAWNPQLGYRAR